MVSIPTSSTEGPGSDSRPGQPKTLKLVFAASLLSKQHLGVKSKTGWPRVIILTYNFMSG